MMHLESERRKVWEKILNFLKCKQKFNRIIAMCKSATKKQVIVLGVMPFAVAAALCMIIFIFHSENWDGE